MEIYDRDSEYMLICEGEWSPCDVADQALVDGCDVKQGGTEELPLCLLHVTPLR